MLGGNAISETPYTMLRMVPLPRGAGEQQSVTGSSPAARGDGERSSPEGARSAISDAAKSPSPAVRERGFADQPLIHQW